ncbi:MAG: DNA-primase RepB domain-containing protein [Cyclobacteriaceae bacterium]
MKNTSITYKAVEQYVQALPCEEYQVRLIRERDGQKEAQGRKWTSDQLIAGVGALQAKNAQGYHIYARPVSMQYILGDDIREERLAEIYALNPSLVIETSPNNYQVFLRLAQVPRSIKHANQICRAFAAQYNADRGSADAMHVGRLPGFTNRKPKYQMASGHFPFVKVVYAQNNVSSFSPPSGGLCLTSYSHQGAFSSNHRMSGEDRSREDFWVACKMIRKGETYEEIREVLSARDKGRDRPRYVEMTIRNARIAVARDQISGTKF